MNYCTECSNAIFDAKWGDHKCSKKQHYIYNVAMLAADCEHFNKGTPAESAVNKEYEEKFED